MNVQPIIQVRGLSTGYGLAERAVPVLREIDLDVGAGSALGIVGESGSGKSTLALALLGSLRAGGHITAGQVLFQGRDIFALDERDRRTMRSQKIGFVPQSPAASLTATMRVADFLTESKSRVLRTMKAKEDQETAALFDELNLPAPGALLGRYPYELSGGQQQRLALAIALLNKPDLLILDEPTTGLDASTKRQVMDLIRRIRQERDLSLICVSHDLNLVANLCEDLAVMYAGRIVELTPASSHATTAQHPYTRALAAAHPKIEQIALPVGIPGSPPAPGQAISGCPFSPRCTYSSEQCLEIMPRRTQTSARSFVHCHHSLSGATDVSLIQEQAAARTFSPDAAALLTAHDIEVSYAPKARGTGGSRHVKALDSVSFTVRQAEIVAVVGESGSGKSTLASILAGVGSKALGRLTFGGAPLPMLVKARTPEQRREIQLVLQHADTALNPRYTVERLLRRCLRLVPSGASTQDEQERIRELLEMVELPAHLADHLPAQLSGGQKQRVNLACALASSPRLLICDEVTSALDVSVQASVLRLLHTMVERAGVSIILITHDLAAAKLVSDRIMVLRQGQVVEHGDVPTVINHPTSSYTIELLESMRS